MFALCLSIASGRQILAEDIAERYFNGLLDRGLVQTAEGAARRRLADEFLRPAERTAWTVRLAEAYAREAELTQGEARGHFWQRAHLTLRELAERGKGVVRREALELERVKLLARQGHLRHWEWSLDPENPPLRDRATAALQSAVDELKQTIETLKVGAKEAGSRTPAQLADGEYTSAEIRGLQSEAEFQLAATLVDLVEVLGVAGDRSTQLGEADFYLRSFTSGWLGDVRTWRSRLLRARLSRLRGDFDAANVIIRTALNEQPAPQLTDSFVAEEVRTDLAQGKIDDALARLLEYGRERTRLSDELVTLQVEALLDARQLAISKQDQATADALLEKAGLWDQQISSSWKMRSRMLLDRASETERFGPELAAIVRAARGAYLAGEKAEAAQKYVAAATLATEQNQSSFADEFTFTAGSVCLESESYREAADQFAALVKRSPDGAKTADAGLLHAYALGKLYEGEPTRSRREAYTTALEVFRKQYAGTPQAAEATWMLAAHDERRNQWTQALAAYREIPHTHERGPVAGVRIAVLYELILDRLRELNQPVDAWEQRAIEDLRALIGEKPQRLTQEQAEVAVRLARILIRHRERRYADADVVLQLVRDEFTIRESEARQNQQPVAPEWTRLMHAASQLSIVSLAGRGELDEARRVLERLGETSPETMLGILVGLGEMSDGIPVERRKSLGILQLNAVQRIEPLRKKLTVDDQRRLDLSLAEANVLAGNVTEAIVGYRGLIANAPNPQLTRTLAELLQLQHTATSLKEAKQLWQTLMNAERKGTAGWLAMRYELAVCMADLGETGSARKLIGITKVLYPELGSADLKAKYEALDSRLAVEAKP